MDGDDRPGSCTPDPGSRKIGVLISGRGSNMEAVVRAAQAESWPARIAAVISNKPDAGGLAFYTEALKAGLTIDQVRQDILQSPEYLAQQAANQAQTASFAAAAQASTMTQDNSAALLAELQYMNQQMVSMQAELAKTAANTAASASSGSQLAQQFNDVTAGGSVLLTEQVN